MSEGRIGAGAALVLLVGCAAPGERPAAGDTAAVRMEQEGAVTEKTLPSGELDTAAVTGPPRQP